MHPQSYYNCFLGGGRIVLGVTVKHDSEVILDRQVENILHSLQFQWPVHIQQALPVCKHALLSRVADAHARTVRESLYF